MRSSKRRRLDFVLSDGTAGVPVTQPSENGTRASEAARDQQWREIGVGAQILRDLGISSIRILVSRAGAYTYVGLAGFGIEIVASEALES